jgi:ArsR family transcriptional regulator, virulence genes transcriptional regulator
MKHTNIDRRELRRVLEMQCEMCKALAHPARLEILELLSGKSTPASELIAALETSKANLSKHISLLVHAGIVEAIRNGRQISYRLKHPEIHKACMIMRSIMLQQLKEGGRLAATIRQSQAR